MVEVCEDWRAVIRVGSGILIRNGRMTASETMISDGMLLSRAGSGSGSGEVSSAGAARCAIGSVGGIAIGWQSQS